MVNCIAKRAFCCAGQFVLSIVTIAGIAIAVPSSTFANTLLHEIKAIPLLEPRFHERTAHDGAGVDHGVVRLSVVGQGQLVEIPAARLATQVLMDDVGAILLQGEAVRNRLAAGLHAEVLCRVAD